MSVVNFSLIERDGKYGAECGICGEFFSDDKGRKGNNGMSKAIAHAKEKHNATSGLVGPRLDTLWSATVKGSGTNHRAGEEILFRERDDMAAAVATAQTLVDGSNACQLIGATIVQVKKIAHLWN